MRRGAPAVVGDEELAFDLDGHRGTPTYGSNIAIDSTCAVCGNMSITPAARSFQPRPLTRKPASRASDAGWQLTYTIRFSPFSGSYLSTPPAPERGGTCRSRPAEARAGSARVSRCRSRGSPYMKKKK